MQQSWENCVLGGLARSHHCDGLGPHHTPAVAAIHSSSCHVFWSVCSAVWEGFDAADCQLGKFHFNILWCSFASPLSVFLEYVCVMYAGVSLQLSFPVLRLEQNVKCPVLALSTLWTWDTVPHWSWVQAGSQQIPYRKLKKMYVWKENTFSTFTCS